MVLGTSSSESASSESALPRMIDKLEKLGARKQVVGLVVPAGYSFNLDGTLDLFDPRHVGRSQMDRRTGYGHNARRIGYVG